MVSEDWIFIWYGDQAITCYLFIEAFFYDDDKICFDFLVNKGKEVSIAWESY